MIQIEKSEKNKTQKKTSDVDMDEILAGNLMDETLAPPPPLPNRLIRSAVNIDANFSPFKKQNGATESSDSLPKMKIFLPKNSSSDEDDDGSSSNSSEENIPLKVSTE